MSRRSLSVLLTVAAVSFAAVGCGDDAADPCATDTGPSGACDDVDGGGADTTPAEIPWLAEGAPPIAPPMLTPCPDGWREVAGAAEWEPTTCDPYPEGGAAECPTGQAHFPGEPDCSPVGAPCPGGDFSAELPTDRTVIYIRPGATGGDGTQVSPYGSVAEFARGTLPSGTVLALSRGTHTGQIRLSRSHELVGACAEATILTTPDPAVNEGVVALLGAGGVVRDLTIADSPRPGFSALGTGTVGRLEGTVVVRTVTSALYIASNAVVTADTVVVRDTAARGGDGMFGRGLILQMGAVLDARRAVFSHNLDVGILTAEDADLTLADTVLSDTQPREADRTSGRALTVQTGSSALVTRTLVTGNRDVAILAGSGGGALELTDVVVRDTDPELGGSGGGRGLNVQLDVTARVSRALFARNHDVGVLSTGVGAVSTLEDLVVMDTRSRPSDGTRGRGLNVQFAASADVRRALFGRNRDIGIVVSDAGSRSSLADVSVWETEGRDGDGMRGRGLNVILGATVEVSRALVARSREIAAIASRPDTSLSLTDVVLRETQGQSADDTGGRGLNVQLGASATLRRGLVADSRDFGLGVISGSTGSFEDVFVTGVRARACAATTCSDQPAGHGLGSYGLGSSARLTRFSVRASELCGLHVADGAELDLESGDVTGHPVGACVQVEGYDITRLMNDVRYSDNETNLQSTSLPVPEPAEMVPSVGP